MSNPKFDEFVDAICEGNVATIQEYLKEGNDPDGDDKLRLHERPLTQALLNEHFQIADMLLEAGAKPRYGAAFLENFLGQDEYEPYIEKILNDAAPEISESIQNGFLKALELGDLSLAERLFALCPSPHDFTTRRTPLCEMILADNEELALWLLQLGFDHLCRNEDEDPPAMLAVLADHAVVLQRLFELGESPDLRVRGHKRNLQPFSLYGKLKHIGEFPKNDQFELFHEGSLLHTAAVAGSPKCARLLLETGLDPEAADSEGRTPSLLASLGGDATQEVLKLLPKPDSSSGLGLVDLLAHAILKDDLDGVQQAIDNGVDLSVFIESPNWSQGVAFLGKAPPLTYAAVSGNSEILQALIDAGADLEQDDWPVDEKWDLAGLIFMIRNSSFNALLNMPMAGGRPPLGWAALAGEAEAMKCLIEAGANVEARDIFDFTVLHLAAMSDSPAALEVALELNIDLHSEGMDRMTPLHMAAAVNAVKTIPILIEAGADTTRKNKDGETPYLTAREWGKPGAYQKLEPHTPEQFRKKQRKKQEPEWEWNREEFQALLKRAKKSHHKEGKRLSTKKFRNSLAKAAKDDTFRVTAEAIRKKLKGSELGSWDDSPHLVWMEDVKISPARLLKIQQEYLGQGIFVVRELLPQKETCRIFVIPTSELPELLGAFGTNGVNMGFDPDLTIAWLLNLYERHPYRVIGISYDGIEFCFKEPVKEPNDLVQELMIACPPEMDENQTIKRLQRKLKSKTPQVLLWWG